MTHTRTHARTHTHTRQNTHTHTLSFSLHIHTRIHTHAHTHIPRFLRGGLMQTSAPVFFFPLSLSHTNTHTHTLSFNLSLVQGWQRPRGTECLSPLSSILASGTGSVCVISLIWNLRPHIVGSD